MKIGNKEIVYSQVFLIPSGHVATDKIDFGTTIMPIEVSVEAATEDRKDGTIWWELDPERGCILIFYGRVPSIAASSPILELGRIGGGAVEMFALYFGNSHVCSMHVQILRGD